MSVNLEAFSFRSAPVQGWMLYHLTHARSIRPWLQVNRPETAERYRDRRHAIYNVGRLAVSEELDAVLIRHHGMPRGVATIIFNQTVSHPNGRTVSGHHLDYWLAPGMNHSVHTPVAEQLIDFAQARQPGEAYFATATPGETSGFRQVMTAVGEAAILSCEGTEGPLSKISDQPLQLFSSGKWG